MQRREVAPLIGARQGHGALEVLRIMEFNVDPDVVGQAAGEQLRLLIGGQAAGVHHTRLELVLVRCDRRREREPNQVRQMVRAEWRPEALVTQALEIFPQRLASVPFEDAVPLLGGAGEVEGGEPDFLGLGGTLRAEELVTAVEPA
jgi:hypothetical protein